MNKWLKIGIIVVIVFIGLFMAWQYYQCRKKGKDIGVSYKCGCFRSTPIMMTALKEYYDIKYNKCYRFTDFGDSMSVREVDINYCH